MHRIKRYNSLPIVFLTLFLILGHFGLVRAESQVVLGLVTSQDAVVHSEEQAEALGDYLARNLQRAVQIRLFDDQAALHQWLVQHQIVDVAWLSDDFLGDLPIGEVTPLAQMQPLGENVLHGQFVARQGVDLTLFQDFQNVLLTMQDTSSGKDLLERLQGARFLPGAQRDRGEVRPLLSVAALNRPAEPAPEVVEPAPEVVDPAPEVVDPAPEVVEPAPEVVEPAPEIVEPAPEIVEPAPETVEPTDDFVVKSPTPSQYSDRENNNISTESKVVLGLVAGRSGIVRSQDQAEALGHYIDEQLMPVVKASLFDDQNKLHQWLVQYQVVHVAWFDDDFLAGLPVGEVLPIAQLESSPGSELSGQIVARQGLSSELMHEVQNVLLHMQEDATGRDLLAQLQGERFLPGEQWDRGEVRPLQPLLAVNLPATEVVTPASQIAVKATEQVELEPELAEPVEPVEPVESVESEPIPGEVVEVEPVAEPDEMGSQDLRPIITEDLIVQPSTEENPSPKVEKFLDSLPTEKVDGARQVGVGSEAAGGHDLTDLMGKTELPVLVDIEGQFVNMLAENRIMDDEFTSPVGEATISQSILAGRSFSRDSFAALARTEQARAKTEQAFALLLPSMSIRASTGQETSKPSVEIDEDTGELISKDTHSRTDASFVLRQPLFDLPTYLDWKRRDVLELAGDEYLRASDGDAYLSTVESYLSLASTRLQTDVTRDFEGQLSELLDYIEKRATAGAASVSDMARVNARSEETLSFRLEQESAHAAAWVEFVRLTNLVPQKLRLPVPDDVGAGVLPETFDMAVAKAMQFNPEIASITAELEAAKIDQSAAKGRYLPRIDAEYTYNYSLHAGGEPDNDGQRDERIMAVLNWDLFNSGRDYNYHLERSARYQEIKYRLDDQRRRVIQALSANYASLATTKDRIDAGYLELDSITTAVEAMSKRMLSGNQSLLDLLDVYDRLYRARARLVNLHVLEMNTVAQLVRLTLGTPWAPPEAISAKSDEGRVSTFFTGTGQDDEERETANRYN